METVLWGKRSSWATGLLAFGLCATPALADESANPGSPGAAGPEPTVSLEKLFELPSGFEPRKADRKGGVTEVEWRERFREARDEVASSQAELDRSKAELVELAQSSDAWTVAPPMGGLTPPAGSEAPLNYELRQKINRDKREVERAKRRLLDLEVEANLAGVPESWRTVE